MLAQATMNILCLQYPSRPSPSLLGRRSNLNNHPGRNAWTGQIMRYNDDEDELLMVRIPEFEKILPFLKESPWLFHVFLCL